MDFDIQNRECTERSPRSNEFCQPNGGMRGVASCRDKGMRGEDAGALCLSGAGRSGLCLRRHADAISSARGQAQGPHPTPRPPLVPTERGRPASIPPFGRQISSGRRHTYYLIRSANIIRTEVHLLPYSVGKVHQDEDAPAPTLLHVPARSLESGALFSPGDRRKRGIVPLSWSIIAGAPRLRSRWRWRRRSLCRPRR